MSSLRDGLGGEELQISGLQAGSMASPYFAGSITTESQISGANVYSTAAVEGVTLSGTNIYAQTTIIGENVYGDTNISGATLKATTGTITNLTATTGSVTNIGGVTQFSGTTYLNDEGELRSVKAGATFGALVQAGSSTLASNEKWVAFDTAYNGNPVVALGTMTGGAGAAEIIVIPGSLNAGSFYVSGTNASDAFSWVSVGI